jgi:hypothetical protein
MTSDVKKWMVTVGVLGMLATACMDVTSIYEVAEAPGPDEDAGSDSGTADDATGDAEAAAGDADAETDREPDAGDAGDRG